MPMEREPPKERKERPRAVTFGRNMNMFRFQLSNINQGIQSYYLGQRVSGTFGAATIRRIGDSGGDKTEGDGPESDAEYSAYSYTDEDDDAKPLIRCPSCEFEIDFSRVSFQLDIDPENMLCPVCDEILGDAIRVAQKSSSQKKTWKSDKSSISSGDSVVLDKKVPARGSKHEPVPVPTSSGVHPGEGSSSNASGISNTKGAGTDAPVDIEEKRLRASFARELVNRSDGELASVVWFFNQALLRKQV